MFFKCLDVKKGVLILGGIKMLTAEEIMNLKEPPTELLEQYLFQVLEGLRFQYFNNQIDKETAIRYKDKAVSTYNSQVKLQEYWVNRYKEYIANLAKTELLRTDLRKILQSTLPDIEKANKTLNISLEIINLVFKGEEYKWK